MSISTFTGLETALRGLMASQQALDVTGENITNASTPGYTRQTVTMQTTPGLQVNPGVVLGTGVDVTGYQRVRDNYLDTQLRAQTMLQGAADTTQDGLSQVEGVLNEPGSSGLSSLLDAYNSAWQDVTNNPSDPPTRQALVQAASNLTDGFNSLSSQLSTIQSQTAQETQLTVQQANSDAQTIQSLNQAIYSAESTGNTPNDLLDQRDSALDDLSSLGNVTTVDNGDGTLTVSLDGVTVADKSNAYTLSESGGTISNNMATPQTATPGATTGKIGALIALRDTTIPGYQTQLNNVASALITQTNAQHEAGYGSDGVDNRDFFGGTDASNISVVATTTTVAAASSATADPGDNTNAVAISALSTTPVASLGNVTVNQGYSQLITTIGSNSQAAQLASSNADALVSSLQNKRDSVSGVSLDEEMTNLIKYQQGYQAAARALNAMNDAVNLLIQQVGSAGM